MSDSENEGEMKRLTNVDELKEILASFDAADRKTSARGVMVVKPWENDIFTKTTAVGSRASPEKGAHGTEGEEIVKKQGCACSK